MKRLLLFLLCLRLIYLYDNIRNITDVAGIVRNRIKHFFEHYKDMDKDKWVKVLEWGDIEIAKNLIEEGVKRNLSN